MIELQNVSFKYSNENSQKALDNINLRIDPGEFVFIVGASGAGKSSLLKLLMRENVPDEGTIFVNGFNLNKIKKGKVPYFRRTVGVVFQDFRLIKNMTVYDNVAFVLRVTNSTTRHIRNMVPYVLNLVGLAEKAKRFPNELSGGEQQRVALARALANDPSLIIADEPTGNIDPELSFEVMNLLKEINKSCGTTVVVVTHEHELVRHFGGRTVNFDKGAITFDGVIGGNKDEG
jgi:cell division transport system ATP-binding protein